MQTQKMSAAEILKKLIAYPSITPKECGIYDFLRALLPSFEAIELHRNEVKNIFLYRVFGRGAWDLMQRAREDKGILSPLRHLCFCGHVDVVPAGEGWSSDPFSPREEGGKIYGRGAQDMKGGVAAFIQALHALEGLQNEDAAPVMISVLLTSDEEGAGVDGVRYALECLEKMGLIPHFSIVAEPTCIKELGDSIKIGRRGSINGILRLFGRQGHVAYPEKCQNPIELLGARLGQLAGKNLDEGDEFFAPSKMVITDIRGGMEVVNVTPSELKILFNVRHSTHTTKESLTRYLQSVLEGLEYELELKVSAQPFLTEMGGFVRLIEECIQSKTGRMPIRSTSGGTSDARFLAPYGVEVVEFGLCNDLIHAVDECTSVQDVETLSAIFSEVVARFQKGWQKG